MNLQLVEQITKKQMRNDIPEFKAGDTLKVFVKIKEGEKFRIQLFEGVCIARKGSEFLNLFTVRKISYQVGVERTFPVHTQLLIILKLLKLVKYVVLNLDTYVDYLVKLLELKKLENRNGSPFLFFLIFCIIDIM